MIDFVKSQDQKTARAIVPRQGNQNATKSSLYAKSDKARRLRDNQVRWILRKMKSLCPWLERADLYLMRRFAELELLSSRAYAALRESELTNKSGNSKRLLDDYRRIVALQVVVAREIGLTPAARAALRAGSRDAPYDLVGELARDRISEAQAERAIAAGDSKPVEGGD